MCRERRLHGAARAGARLAHDPGLGGELVGGHVAARGEGRAGGAHEHQLVAYPPLYMQARIAQLSLDQAAVDCGRAHRRRDRLGVAEAQVEIDARVGVAERLDESRHEVVADGSAAADHKVAAGRRLLTPSELGELVQRSQHGIDAREQHAAAIVEDQAPTDAREQRAPEGPLKLLERHARRRLGEVQPLSAARYVPLLRDGCEHLELTHRDGHYHQSY